MRSNAFLFISASPTGTIDQSLNLSVPVNGNLGLIINPSNSLIKSIDCFITQSSINEALIFWDVRFQGLNRDGSLITQNAGIIQNPISGSWGNAFVKDSNLDFVLSSKKSQIVFPEPILLGGIRPLSFSVKYKNPITAGNSIWGYITINYE